MFRTVVAAASFAALTALGASPAAAFEGPGPGRLVERFADELALDEATRADIRAILEASRESSEDLRAALEGARLGLQDLMAAESPDREAVLEQIAAVGEARTALRQHQTLTLFEVGDRLAPEQRTRLREWMFEEGQRRRGRFARFREGSTGLDF